MDEFIENFKKAVAIYYNDCEEGTTGNDNTKRDEAIEAVACYAKSKMEAQNVINLFFADHGWEHSMRLSKYALFMMGKLKKDCRKTFSNIDWDNMLVLLWTSIALHDIGMNDIAKNKEELIEIIKEQGGRIEHVKKSGEWISRIIDHIKGRKEMDDKEEVDKLKHKWNAYWECDSQLDSIVAFRIVKDIVLMHGENEEWLEAEKIGSIDRKVFSDINENYTNKKILEYDEGILCLIDLLDICADRMKLFGNESLNNIYLDMKEDKKRNTFEHWVSHKITSVNCEKYDKNGRLSLDIYRYSMDSAMYLNNVLCSVYPHLGAIEACLKWGNDKRLKSILADFGYNGIELNLCKQDISTWNEIHRKAKEFNIFKRNEILKINSELDGTSNVFINEMVHYWIDKNWKVEENIYSEYDFKVFLHSFRKVQPYIFYIIEHQEILVRSQKHFL